MRYQFRKNLWITCPAPCLFRPQTPVFCQPGKIGALRFSRFTTYLQRHRDAPTPARLNGLRASALAAAALLGAPLAWGACLNNATHGRATTHDTCTATQTSYPNARDTLLADTGGLTLTQNGGDNSYGVLARVGGRITIDGATSVTLQNSGQSRRGVLALDAGSQITLNAATVTAQTLWNATGSDYTFTAQGGAYTDGAAGSSLILKLEGAAKWNLNADSTLKNMELAGNAELRVDGDYSLTPAAGESVKNTAGVIDLSDAATGDKLTINGKYEGSGGRLKLDVDLSAAAVADVLKVTGNVTGSTQIAVTQLPGTAMATTGNGILIAEISGTSPADAFTLPTPLISGSLQYKLEKVGSNWYLQSSPYTGANVASVPTLSHLGLLLTGGLLAGAAARARRKQKKA